MYIKKYLKERGMAEISMLGKQMIIICLPFELAFGIF